MIHPVGSLSPSVYWRRRLALLGSLVLLIALTAYVLRPSGGSHNNAGGSPTSPRPSNTVGSTSQSTPTSTTPTSPISSSTAKASTTSHVPTGQVPAACVASQLKVAAVVAQPSYRVGDRPMVLLQVTNTGPAPCVQDLADSQVELRVYNGESRVWGSHDCSIEPGTSPRTLAANQAVRVSVVWSGLSSQPKCAGTRQRVGAGTYTLYALLSGKEGTAAQFSIA